MTRRDRKALAGTRTLAALGVSWLVLMLLFSSFATGAEIEGVRFEDEIEFKEPVTQTLRLYGTGLLRYRVVFRGYVAGLYLPDDVSGDQALDDVSRRLELSYFWSIAGKDFADAANQLLERELSVEALASLRSRIDTLHRAYRDVRPDDRYALTYFPGFGTELRLNGERLVSIPGADFAKAYFGIWLGRKPLDEGLRDALLRRR